MTRQALGAPPTFLTALSLHQQGRLEDAGRLYELTLASYPNHFESLHFLGLVRAGQRRLHDALGLIRRAIEQRPDSADAILSLGDTLAALGDRPAAMRAYKRALALDPAFAEAHNNFAAELAALGRHDEAIAHYERALAIKPDFAEAMVNLGNVLLALNRAGDAAALFERALRLQPGFAAALNNLGNAFVQMNRLHDAFAQYEKAVAAKPDYAGAHNNLGTILLALDRPAEAIARFETALAHAPDYAEAHNNLGNALLALNRLPEAMARYEKAAALKPGYVEALWNDALARLAAGDFAEGWRRYETRWDHAKLGLKRRQARQPLWQGADDLHGRTILLHAEQGFGDTLQFVRYVPLVARRGADIVLEVQRPLVPLLQGIDGVSRVVAQGEPLPPVDCHCPLMSLPLALAAEVPTIPAACPYLAVPPEKLAKWRSVVGEDGPPCIGLAWSGSATHRNDRNRSLPLARLRPIFDMPGVRFAALQKEFRADDEAVLQSIDGILAPGDRLHDFADTAALVALCDLVITVDTAIAHLAGALGKPVWILLPFAADWRWMVEREDSPWYPTARLFRQKTIGDWDGVVARVRAELRERFLGSSRPS